MKKFLAIIFSAVILAMGISILSGCGCSNNENQTSKTPSTNIVGNWGERSDDIEVEFNDDGTCTIGGINGTYEIDEENRLTVTPNNEGNSEESATPLVFEYYNGDGNLSSIPQNQWAISDNKLYINGYQYTKEDSDDSGADNASSSNSSANNSANSSSQTISSSSNSKPSTNNSSSNSSGTSSENNSNSNANNSSNTTNKPDNSSSTIENSSVPDNSSSSASIQIEQGEEESIINIYQKLDDF